MAKKKTAIVTPRDPSAPPAEGFVLALCSAPNPDRGEVLTPSPPFNLIYSAGATWADASKRCMEYITQWELGGGNWTGGEIRTLDRKTVVGRVSYNGRVWPAAPWYPEQAPLWSATPWSP